MDFSVDLAEDVAHANSPPHLDIVDNVLPVEENYLLQDSLDSPPLDIVKNSPLKLNVDGEGESYIPVTSRDVSLAFKHRQDSLLQCVSDEERSHDDNVIRLSAVERNSAVKLMDQDEDLVETNQQSEEVMQLTVGENANSHREITSGSRFYECGKCEGLFRSQEVLDRHVKVNHIFTCTLCSREFEDKQLFEAHVVTEHAAANINCHVCQKQFKTQEDMNVHVAKEHVKLEPTLPDVETDMTASSSDVIAKTELVTPVVKMDLIEEEPTKEISVGGNLCSKCGKQFKKNSQLRRHMKFHQKIKIHECSVCGKCFIERCSLNRHMESHANKKLECLKCGKILKNENTYKKHAERHLGRHFTCDLCAKQYKTAAGLEAHRSKHNPKGTKFTCLLCNKDCLSPSYLRLHQRQKHGTQNRSHICQYCGQIFKWKQTLQGHIALVHDITSSGSIKIVSCHICGKKHLNQHTLKLHLTKHDDEKKYECPYSNCGLQFKFKQSRDKHVLVVHSTKKEHQCSMCGKLFKTKSYLSMHVSSVHVPVDKVKCTHCDKLFKTKRIMLNHIRIVHDDTIKKKHKCGRCGQSFFSPKDLRRHEKAYTGVKDFKCVVCGKSFSRKDNLTVHMKIHQNSTKPPLEPQLPVLTTTTPNISTTTDVCEFLTVSNDPALIKALTVDSYLNVKDNVLLINPASSVSTESMMNNANTSFSSYLT